MGGAPLAPPHSASPPCYPQPVQISTHLLLQEPLSRRGRGPGLILVLDHYALTTDNENEFEPPPARKWAEEGFAVVQLLVPGRLEDGGEFPLQRAIELLKSCASCDFGEGVGLISYLSRLPYYVEEAVCLTPQVRALVSYGGRKVTTLSETAASVPPQLIHMAGPAMPRRESCSIGPDFPPRVPLKEFIQTHRYEDAKRESGWMLPADEEYCKSSATLAHTRNLAFLKPLLGGPYFNLEELWNEYVRVAFRERDVEQTANITVARADVCHLPTTGKCTASEFPSSTRTEHLIYSKHPDVSASLVSRTIGVDRIVEESILTFTQQQLAPIFPDIEPSEKKRSLPTVNVVGFRGDRLCYARMYWDQLEVTEQMGR